MKWDVNIKKWQVTKEEYKTIINDLNDKNKKAFKQEIKQMLERVVIK